MNTIKKIILMFGLVGILVGGLGVDVASAQFGSAEETYFTNSFLNADGGGGSVNTDGDYVSTGRLRNFNDVVKFVIGIINALISIIMAAAVLTFLYGVYTYVSVTAKKEDGRWYILYGLGGLFVMISVYGLINLLSGSIRFSNNQSLDEGIPRVR